MTENNIFSAFLNIPKEIKGDKQIGEWAFAKLKTAREDVTDQFDHPDYTEALFSLLETEEQFQAIIIDKSLPFLWIMALSKITDNHFLKNLYLQNIFNNSAYRSAIEVRYFEIMGVYLESTWVEIANVIHDKRNTLIDLQRTLLDQRWRYTISRGTYKNYKLRRKQSDGRGINYEQYTKALKTLGSNISERKKEINESNKLYNELLEQIKQDELFLIKNYNS